MFANCSRFFEPPSVASVLSSDLSMILEANAWEDVGEVTSVSRFCTQDLRLLQQM